MSDESLEDSEKRLIVQEISTILHIRRITPIAINILLVYFFMSKLFKLQKYEKKLANWLISKLVNVKG